MPAAAAKDPRRVDAGLLGARSRWGPPRVVRLSDLDPDVRRAIVALVDAARSAHKEAAPAIVSPGAAMSEGHGNDRPAD